jgi:DNA polymerase-3 subunit delta'
MTTATGFDAIVGQQHPIKLLKTFIRNGTMPHALLFTGDAGVGKKMTATALAMACNCLTLKSALRHPPHPEAIDACGLCAPAKKLPGATIRTSSVSPPCRRLSESPRSDHCFNLWH